MIILSTVKRRLVILGIFPISKEKVPANLQNYRILINKIHIGFVIISLLLYTASVFYFVGSKAKTFAQYAEGSLFCALTLFRIISYLVINSQKSDLSSLMSDLESTIEQRSSSPECREIHTLKNIKTEQFTKSFWKYFSLTIKFNSFVKIFQSYYKYYVLGMSAKSFSPLMPTAFLWNWRTPTGYFAAICFQFYWYYGGIFLAMTILLTFSGCCSLFGGFAVDIIKQLSDMNANTANASQLKKKLHDAIKLHNIAIDFIDRLADQYQFLSMAFFGTSITGICSALLSFNAAIDRGNVGEIVRLLTFAAYMIIFFGLLCFSGDSLTTQFDEIHTTISTIPWFEFPLDIQKKLIPMLCYSQESKYIYGLMNVQCSRDAFQRVISASFGYFSTLRGLSR